MPKFITKRILSLVLILMMACTLIGPAFVYADDSPEIEWDNPSSEEAFPAQDPDEGEELLSAETENLTVSEEALPVLAEDEETKEDPAEITDLQDLPGEEAAAAPEAETEEAPGVEAAETEETLNEEEPAKADSEPVLAEEEETEDAAPEAALSEGEASKETDPETTEDPENPEDPETPEDPSPVSIEGATITGIKDKVYSGKKQTQKIQVSLTVDETVRNLSKDKDYTISYSNNINAGTAKITVTGIGDYTGTITRTFKIKKAPLSSVALKYSEMPYRAVPRTQTSTLKVTAEGGSGAITLKRNNYKVSYSNNTNVGTAKITVTGRGNFTGSITKKYKITPVSLYSVKLAYSSLLYTGEERTQTKAMKVRAVVAGKLIALKKRDGLYGFL